MTNIVADDILPFRVTVETPSLERLHEILRQLMISTSTSLHHPWCAFVDECAPEDCPQCPELWKKYPLDGLGNPIMPPKRRPSGRIDDEFSRLPVSRQRKWQLRKVRDSCDPITGRSLVEAEGHQ